MRRRHPALTAVTVADQGHAPLLKDNPAIEAIRHFLLQIDVDQPVVTLAIA
jgi:hypothetical protein